MCVLDWVGQPIWLVYLVDSDAPRPDSTLWFLAVARLDFLGCGIVLCNFPSLCVLSLTQLLLAIGRHASPGHIAYPAAVPASAFPWQA
jgi:hypothetical protein